MAAYTQFNWGKSLKLSLNHRWFLLRETQRNSALQILIIKKKKSELIAQQITAGRAKKECGLFLSLCYHPKLALSHFFSLPHLQVSHMGIWLSQKTEGQQTRENTPPGSTYKILSDTHTKRRAFQLFSCNTQKYRTVSHSHLQITLFSIMTTSRTQNDYFLLYLYVTPAL